MNIPTPVIPQHTIDTLAKGVYKEATRYGFEKQDILRFVNSLLTLSMNGQPEPVSLEEKPSIQMEGVQVEQWAHCEES